MSCEQFVDDGHVCRAAASTIAGSAATLARTIGETGPVLRQLPMGFTIVTGRDMGWVRQWCDRRGWLPPSAT